jgi:hypothetical protein
MLLALPFFAVFVLIAAAFLSAGAAFAGIEERSYWKSIISVVVVAIVGGILGGILGFIGLKDGIIAFVASVTLNLFVIKSVFMTGWGKAFVAWLVQVVLTVVVIVVPLMFLFGAALLFAR